MKRVRRSDPGPFSPLGCACRRHVRLIAHVDVRALDAPERGGCPPQRAPHTQLSTHARGRARHGPVWPRRPPRPSRRSHSRSVSVSVSVTPPLNLSTKRRPGVSTRASSQEKQVAATGWVVCPRSAHGRGGTVSRAQSGSQGPRHVGSAGPTTSCVSECPRQTPTSRRPVGLGGPITKVLQARAAGAPLARRVRLGKEGEGQCILGRSMVIGGCRCQQRTMARQGIKRALSRAVGVPRDQGSIEQ